MNQELKRLILDLLAQHNILTVATIRKDGWPQATTVAYVNDGLDIYAATFPESQKVRNIKTNNKVSLTIDRDYEDWNKIKELFIAAYDEVLTDSREIQHAEGLLARKFPQLAGVAVPEPSEVSILRFWPKVISILNYEKGSGHTDFVEI